MLLSRAALRRFCRSPSAAARRRGSALVARAAAAPSRTPGSHPTCGGVRRALRTPRKLSTAETACYAVGDDKDARRMDDVRRRSTLGARIADAVIT